MPAPATDTARPDDSRLDNRAEEGDYPGTQSAAGQLGRKLLSLLPTGVHAALLGFVLLLLAIAALSAGLLELKRQRCSAPPCQPGQTPIGIPISLFVLASVFLTLFSALALLGIDGLLRDRDRPTESSPAPTGTPRGKRPRQGLAKEAVLDLFAQSSDVAAPDLCEWHCVICMEDRALADAEEDGAMEGAGEDDEESSAGLSLAVRLPCGHVFDRGCLRTWLKRAHTCPTCVKDLRPTSTETEEPSSTGSLAHEQVG